MIPKKPDDDHPNYDVPLFDMDVPPDSTRKKRSVKAVRQGKCPNCHAEKMGLLSSGVHLVWRSHTYRTWSGTPVTCPSSGVAVCVAPERTPLIPSDPAKCRHP